MAMEKLNAAITKVRLKKSQLVAKCKAKLNESKIKFLGKHPLLTPIIAPDLVVNHVINLVTGQPVSADYQKLQSLWSENKRSK